MRERLWPQMAAFAESVQVPDFASFICWLVICAGRMTWVAQPTKSHAGQRGVLNDR